MEKDVFVTFDLENTSSLYDDFYEKAEKIGLKKYVPGKYTFRKKDADLPNTTLYGKFTGSDSAEINEYVREEISKIFKELNVKGTSLIIVSESWRTNYF